ncbi:2339_t:CDS:1 [Funneliformis mosseae]|uniref:2339_t:CDS:1 n=1 Tax=Funneliformis mosseae TaxID=27381 RepID=A0A9N9NIP2_FUNMO|nr:2339_t:CDS:1 [Funneliformis mosseae]
MAPVHPSHTQNTNSDTCISHFRSFTNFDKMIDSKTVQCKCGVEVQLDRPFKITNFERHINSHNCILGVDNQPSLYLFFDQSKNAQGEREEEFLELLPCTGLFGDLYTEYATNSSAFFGGGKKPEVIGKTIFPDKFSQDTPFSRKKLNKDQTQQFNTALQATAT